MMQGADDKVWDYVVVGAGSSGCVIAEQLSARSATRVLLIESGGENKSPFVTMPRGFGRLNGRKEYNWIYRAEPTGGATRREFWLRGRGLGGSGAVNGSVYVRGLPADFDAWRHLGCTGWGWSDMQPHFEAVENGTDNRSPLGITLHPGGNRFCDAAIAAASGLGVPAISDLNTATGAAVGYQPRSILNGRRRSAANAFLEIARKRKNLSILTHTQVQRILFDGTCASGVEICGKDGKTRTIRTQNLVLCAGTLNTPKLLMLSGIGPAKHLRDHGIAVVANAPDVGQNLREHRLLSLQFRLSGGSDNSAFQGLGLLKSVAHYYLNRSGPMAQSAFEVGGFIRTQSGAGLPDAQIGLAPISMDKTTLKMKAEAHPGALCGGYPMRPDSAGFLALTSSDPVAPLHIEPNYLAAATDRQISVDITRFIRRMFARPELAGFHPVESFPGPDIATDDEIIEAYHRTGQAGFHAAGTCRMGDDADSVVDLNTAVRGVSGLYVADISIMPRLVSGNTNAPAMAMAHRAAGLISQQT